MDHRDYIVKTDDGKELEIEVGNASESKRRIEAYYNALLQHKSQNEDFQTKKAIGYVVDSMDESEVAEIEQGIIKKDSRYVDMISEGADEALAKRMMAYMNKFMELSQAQKELSAPMQEMIDKYKNFDFDALVKEEINGNVFTYRKDKFPIEQYRQELEELGNKNKGNQWSVFVSSDGRLVIY